ncbi:hypothetical protein D3C87_1507580 [compost metagenome]
MFRVETDRVFFVAIVQLADAFNVDALLLQHLAPALRITHVRHGVIPMPGLVHAMAGGERRARRHADRAGRVGVRKACATRGKRVQVWRLDERMPGTTHERGIVFIGHDDDDVFAFHSASWI